MIKSLILIQEYYTKEHKEVMKLLFTKLGIAFDPLEFEKDEVALEVTVDSDIDEILEDLYHCNCFSYMRAQESE